MNYSPRDILNYVLDSGYESEFLSSLTLNKGNYSIGEIPDKRFTNHNGVCKLISKAFSLNIEIEDDEIRTAIINGIYITPFISRKDDTYQVHFLVHEYPSAMKSQFEDKITKEVVNYMIMKTIIALRLDTPLKVEQYAGIKSTK